MTCMSNIYAHLTLMMVEKVKHSASMWGDPKKKKRIFFKKLKKIYLHFVQKTLNPLQNTLHWRQYTCPIFFPTV